MVVCFINLQKGNACWNVFGETLTPKDLIDFKNLLGLNDKLNRQVRSMPLIVAESPETKKLFFLGKKQRPEEARFLTLEKKFFC